MPYFGTTKRQFGPALIPSSLGTVYNQSSSLIYDVIKHIHVTNRTASAANFSLFLGASGGSAAGTEIFDAVSISGGQSLEWYGNIRMESTDFLTGISNAANALVITGEGKQYISEAGSISPSFLVPSSFVHNASGLTGTLGAAVQVGDVILITCSGQTNHATSCIDQLGNVYTLLQNTAGSNGHWSTLFSAPVTVPGTPSYTVTTTGTGAATSGMAFRGLVSSTPHKVGTAATDDTTANPMTVSFTTTVQCMGFVNWTNQGTTGSFIGFTLGATQLNFDTADADANGYLVGQPPGTYLLGANFTTGDGSDEVIVAWFQE
jgi:hypothetical protein